MGLFYKSNEDWYRIAITPSCSDQKRKKAIQKINDPEVFIKLVDYLSDPQSKDWDSNRNLIDLAIEKAVRSWGSADEKRTLMAAVRIVTKSNDKRLCQYARGLLSQNYNAQMLMEKLIDSIKESELLIKIIEEVPLSRKKCLRRFMEVLHVCDSRGALFLTKNTDLNDPVLQKCLGLILRFSDHPADRHVAVENIQDDSVLRALARSDPSQIVRFTATERARDAETLSYVLHNEADKYIRQMAVGYVSDEETLSYVLRHDNDKEVCIRAIKKIKDRGLLRETARNTHSEAICAAAVKALNDAAFAKEILAVNPSDAVCVVCAGLIPVEMAQTDAELALLALCGPDDVRPKAYQAMRDKSVFLLYATRAQSVPYQFTASEHEVTMTAMDYLTDDASHEAVLRSRRIYGDKWYFENALSRIRNAQVLCSLVNEKPKTYCTWEVLERLEALDVDWVKNISKEAVSYMVRYIEANIADERYDLTFMARPLARAYKAGIYSAEIALLRGRDIAHLDASGRSNRGKGCHWDSGYTSFDEL